MSGTKTMTLRMTQEMHDHVELAARVDGISVSEWIRRAVDDHVARHIRSVEFRERLAGRIVTDSSILDRLRGESPFPRTNPIAADDWDILTEQDRLEISAAVHQNYFMPQVFSAVAAIIRRHVAADRPATNGDDRG